MKLVKLNNFAVSNCTPNNLPTHKNILNQELSLSSYSPLRDNFVLSNPGQSGSFRANLKLSRGIDGSNVINSTYLFRDMPVMQAIVTYLRENKIDKGTIIDFGCSDGSEIYTLAMLLNPEKRDFGFKFKGYDLSPEIIQDARNGIYSIYDKKMNFDPITAWDIDNKTDAFLIRSQEKLSEEQRMCKKLFLSYFDKIPIPFKLADFTDIIGQEMRKYGDDFKKYWNLHTYKVSKRLKQYCEFNVGDIKDISNGNLKFGDGEKPKVIIFKNAWYHLSKNSKNLDPRNNWSSTKEFVNLKQIIKGLFDSLDHKGILVVGNLYRDHVFMKEDPVHGKVMLEVSPFHKVLKEVGFKPLESSILPTQSSSHGLYAPVIDFPTIWVKE